MRVPAFGPTAVSVSLTAVLRKDGRTILRTGCGFDHTAIDGWVARRFVDALYATLTGTDAATRAPFDA